MISETRAAPLLDGSAPSAWLARLGARRERDARGLFVVEGVGAFLHAADLDRVAAVVHNEVLLRSSGAQQRVRRLRRGGVPVERVTPERFRTLHASARASGVAAVVRQRWSELEAIDPRRGTCWLAVEGMRSPGNLGTILRTAEAAGVAGVILLDPTTDPHDPAVVRASMGALVRLELVRATPLHLGRWARVAGVRCVGTSPRGEVDYAQVPLDRPVVLLVGEERQGLGPASLAACEALARIPKLGRGDSLNVAVATGVVLFDLVRRRVT